MNRNTDPKGALGVTEGPAAQTATMALINDVRGLADLPAELADEGPYQLRQQHSSLVQEQILAYGGRIVKTVGDSFIASFDGPQRAVSCAVAMQQAVEHFYRSQSGPKIGVGIGINVGEAARRPGDLAGEAVSLASRICAVAGPGRILVSQGVKEAVPPVHHQWHYIDRGYHAMRGAVAPHRLYEVEWPGRQTVSRPAPASRPFPTPASRGLGTWRRWAGAVAAVLVLGVVAGGTAALVSGVAGPPTGQQEPLLTEVLTPAAPVTAPAGPIAAALNSVEATPPLAGGPSTPVIVSPPDPGAEVEAAVHRSNAVWMAAVSKDGTDRELATAYADNWLERMVRQVRAAHVGGHYLVVDPREFQVLTLDVVNPDEAVAVAREEWTITEFDGDDRFYAATSPSIEQTYWLERRNGRWLVVRSQIRQR